MDPLVVASELLKRSFEVTKPKLREHAPYTQSAGSSILAYMFATLRLLLLVFREHVWDGLGADVGPLRRQRKVSALGCWAPFKHRIP